MSNAPTMTDFGDPHSPLAQPERTSILALLSMISSLICCIPGLSVLGTFMGIGAIISIGGSNGRLGGRGMAWTGIIVGVLVTMLWGGLAIGAGRAWKEFQGLLTNMNTEIASMESGDFDAARKMLTTQAATDTTDEAFTEFVEAYQADYGKLGEQDLSLGGMMSSFAAAGPVFQNYSGSAMIPMVYHTPGGPIVFVVVANQMDLQSHSDPDNPFRGNISQLSFMRADGSVMELVP